MKHVLITGCSTGIGEYCAKALHANENYKVYATCKSEDDVQKFKQKGIWSCRLDVSDSDSICEGFEEVLASSGGRVDVLFNNAGFGQPGAVEDLSDEVLKEQFQTNFFGPFELTNKVIKIMRQQDSGRIIFNSSVLGFAAMSYRGAYNSSKFALEGLVDTMRLELANSNLDVILIEPGPIRTKFRDTALKKLHKNIDMENSHHKEVYKESLERLSHGSGDAPFTLNSDAVYASLLKAIQDTHPKARYQVTTATILLWYVKRLLPTCLFDKILIKAGA